MKERLVELINKIEKIETLFHSVDGATPEFKIINDVQEFTIWLQAVRAGLREIHGRTHDTFIFEAIHDLDGFNGWRDRRQFDKVKGDLYAIRDNIDSYYPREKEYEKRKEIEPKIRRGIERKATTKQPKIFISHSSKDKEQVELFVDLLLNIGLREDQIFCSSVPGCGIELGKQIFDELLLQFESFDLHVIMILSKNYYESPVCLNEMGAAWVLGVKSDFILLPEFDFSDIKGVVDKNNIGLSLGKDLREAKHRLNQLQNNLADEFHFKKITEIRWEEKRDAFLNAINELKGEE